MRASKFVLFVCLYIETRDISAVNAKLFRYLSEARLAKIRQRFAQAGGILNIERQASMRNI